MGWLELLLHIDKTAYVHSSKSVSIIYQIVGHEGMLFVLGTALVVEYLLGKCYVQIDIGSRSGIMVKFVVFIYAVLLFKMEVE